jgi:transposase
MEEVLTMNLLLAKSVHSRAARRENSPSVDVDKSLKSLPRPEQSNLNASTSLSDRINAGISKKKSASKAKSRAQRLRQQKGIERAEALFDQLEIRKTKSLGRAKKINARRVREIQSRDHKLWY